MKILITGADGQLGRSLQDSAPAMINGEYNIVTPVGRKFFDITKKKHLHEQLAQLKPNIIINAAAYTAVDKAEVERDEARLVNVQGIENLVEWCVANNCTIVHVSTDFVFGGDKSTAYKPSDNTSPLNYYGETKLAGEQALRKSECNHYIVRTGWVYSEHGNNFVKSILRLAATKPTLSVVADQIGTPTYAHHLAHMIWQLIENKPEVSTWHFSDAGVASWYDFATAIIEEAVPMQLLQKNIPVKPITTSDYPTPAKRPQFSLLDKEQTWKELNIAPVHWRVALRSMLARLIDQEKA